MLFFAEKLIIYIKIVPLTSSARRSWLSKENHLQQKPSPSGPVIVDFMATYELNYAVSKYFVTIFPFDRF